MPDATAQLYQQSLSLRPIVRVEGEEGVFQAVSDNFRELDSFLGDLGGTSSGLAPLAKILGGSHVASVRLNPGSDAEIAHGFGRIPRAVVLGVDLEGLGGVVTGSPTGVGNEAWTSTALFLRATIASTYELVIL